MGKRVSTGKKNQEVKALRSLRELEGVIASLKELKDNTSSSQRELKGVRGSYRFAQGVRGQYLFFPKGVKGSERELSLRSRS